jgi:hypothetical protein
MKLASRGLSLLLLLVSLLLAIPVMAKGPVDLITVEGPDLTKPIQITDPDVLNVWIPGQVNSSAPEAR